HPYPVALKIVVVPCLQLVEYVVGEVVLPSVALWFACQRLHQYPVRQLVRDSASAARDVKNADIAGQRYPYPVWSSFAHGIGSGQAIRHFDNPFLVKDFSG